jgi:hypothetical protein
MLRADHVFSFDARLGDDAGILGGQPLGARTALLSIMISRATSPQLP